MAFDFDSFVANSLVGRRVEIAPHFDRWMRGDRYGVVIADRGSQGMSLLFDVKMDKSNDIVQFSDFNLRFITP